MADKFTDMWLKVLLGFVLTLIVLLFGFTATGLDKKVNKDYMRQHESYQELQHSEIKAYLIRIDESTKRGKS